MRGRWTARGSHLSAAASMSADGPLKPSKLRAKARSSSEVSCGRIPHGTITHPRNLSRLNAAGASPRGRSEGSPDASPPLGQNAAGRFAQEHHRAALASAAVLTACARTNSPSAPLNVPSLNPPSSPSPPPRTKTRRGCVCTGVGARQQRRLRCSFS